MQKLWEKQITMPYTDKSIGIFDQEIDNDGNVYIATIFDKEKAKQKVKKGEAPHKLLIIGCTNKGQEIKEYSIDIEGGIITETDMFINENKDVFCSGFYSGTDKKAVFFTGSTAYKKIDAIKGFFFAKIDGQKKELTVMEHQPLKPADITGNIDALSMDDEENIRGYSINQWIFKENGKLILVAEQSIEITTISYGSKSSSSYTTDYRNDIMLISISPEGKIEWAKKIPKYQSTPTEITSMFSSYALALVNDKIYIIYNAHPDKYAKEKWKGKDVWMYRSKPIAPMLISIDFNGNKTRETFYDIEKEKDNAKFWLMPLYCKQFSPNEMIVVASKKKEFKIGKITFTE